MAPNRDRDPSAVNTVSNGPLTLRVARSLRSYIVRVSGELDLDSIGLLRQELIRAEASDAPEVILDLSALEFIDVAGMACLLDANVRFDHGGRFGLLRGPRHVDRVFELAGIGRALPFLD